jgi:DNA repair photolyase
VLAAGFSLTILTKSKLVLRDLDVLRGRDVSVGVTITTADEAEARQWEPDASSVSARLQVLRQAKTAGLKTTLMFGPLLPEISVTGKSCSILLGGHNTSMPSGSVLSRRRPRRRSRGSWRELVR